MTAKRTLAHHPLYGLDAAILHYLTPVLAEMLGKPFLAYVKTQEQLATRRQSGTRKLGALLAKTISPAEIRSQSQLLDFHLELDSAKAFQNVLAASTPDQQGLLELFEVVLNEWCDLENMAAALETAEEYGSGEYAAKVKEVLDLDNTISPVWR